MRMRLPISKVGVLVERNGVSAYLCINSHFGRGEYPLMHFAERASLPHHDTEAYTAEVEATTAITPVEDFCWPAGGECEFEHRKDGQVEIRAYSPGACTTPVLIWIFPNPDDVDEDIYKDFIAATGQEIREWTSDENFRDIIEGSQIDYLVGGIPDSALEELAITREELIERGRTLSILTMERFLESREAQRLGRKNFKGSRTDFGRFLGEIKRLLSTVRMEG